MDLKEAMARRHSVRVYEDRPIEEEKLEELNKLIRRCNEEAGLHIQLVLNEPKAFSSFMAHYGKFENVNSYIVMAGRKSPQLDELCGYYGEMITLKAQMLGLNTCFVYLTYKKIPSAFVLEKGEKVAIVITIGYGKNDGHPHKNRPLNELCNLNEDSPAWFKEGMAAVLLAPTAMNQQKFYLELKGDRVKATGKALICNLIDLGIVKYHFEIGSGKDHTVWL